MSEFNPQLLEYTPTQNITERIREVAVRTWHTIGRIAAAGLVVAGGSLGAFAAEEAVHPTPVAAYDANTGDYPWADAEHVPMPPASDNLTWGYTDKTTCDNKSAEYDCRSYKEGSYYVYDQWGYYIRNCVSYDAWRLAMEFGVDASGLGNATTWDNNAPGKGWVVKTTPEVGDIAQFEGDDKDQIHHPGHVGFVVETKDGKARIAEYNQGLNGNFREDRWVTASKYIDVNGPNPPGFALKVGAIIQSQRRKAPNDWDHDGRSDVVVWRPSDGGWYIRGYSNTWYGWPGDRPVAGDWNNDGRYDPAVYRPSDSTWHMQDINDFVYGKPGDLPVPADWNRDGRLEAAVWRPTTGEWFGRGIGWLTSFGLAGDVPVSGDWNGDGFPEVALYRPSTQEWMVQGSPNSRFGEPGDVPMPADWNGDGKLEAAVWRPSDGGWHIQGVADFPYGHPGDIPTWGDWDGNGAIDATVIEPTDPWTWCVRGGGYAQWGKPGDVVVMAVN